MRHSSVYYGECADVPLTLLVSVLTLDRCCLLVANTLKLYLSYGDAPRLKAVAGVMKRDITE